MASMASWSPTVAGRARNNAHHRCDSVAGSFSASCSRVVRTRVATGGLDEVAGVAGHPVGILADPLDVAADGIGQRRADGFAGQMLSQRVRQIVDRHFVRLARIVDAAAGVDELAVLVKDIKVGRAQRAIGAGHVLRLVVQVAPWALVFLHARYQVLEIVLGTGVLAVRVGDILFQLMHIRNFAR